MLNSQTIARLIAQLLILIFVLTTPMLLLAFNTQQLLTRQAFYDELLAEPALFDAIIPEMAAELVKAVRQDSQTRSSPSANLSAADWEVIIRVAAPPEWMQNKAQEMLRIFFAWLRDESPLLENIVLPWGEARTRLLQDQERKSLKVFIQAQPPCISNQGRLDKHASLLPVCRPPDDQLAGFYSSVWSSWQQNPQEFWRQLLPGEHPDDASLGAWLEQTDAELEEKTGWHSTHWALNVSSWLLLALIGLQCICAPIIAASVLGKSRLRWAGTPLALAGLLALLSSAVLLLGASAMLANSGDSSSLETITEHAIYTFLRGICQPLLWQGGLLTVFGAGMWLASLFSATLSHLSTRSEA